MLSNNSILENKPIEIAAVGLEQVLEIRREVMWPGKPISFVSVLGDEEAIHQLDDNFTISIVKKKGDHEGLEGTQRTQRSFFNPLRP